MSTADGCVPSESNKDNNDTETVASTQSDDPDYQHDFEAGDHVYRWTHLLLYPVQVHGIVLSAGPEMVTIADFGLTSQANQPIGPEASQEHPKVAGKRRLIIVTLVEDREIRKWRKVHYGENLAKKGLWKKMLSLFTPKSDSDKLKDEQNDENTKTGGNSDDNDEDDEEEDEEDFVVNITHTSQAPAAGESSTEERQEQREISLPTSDPPGIVRARVRYLLEHETVQDGKHHNTVLPPYHLFFANSECIAVWCKTGSFSTIQAAIFLHSTALGQVKSTATLAAVLAAQTVTVTTTSSAGGLLGWLGFTTTTTSTVPLVTMQPWILPVVGAYGVAAVSTPLVVLLRAKGKWEQATRDLTDGFWAWAGPDVYVEAIEAWSCLGGR